MTTTFAPPVPREGLQDALRAQAWAKSALQQLAPDGASPTRWLINTALAKPLPPAGQPIAVRWEKRGDDGRVFAGHLGCRVTSGFVICGPHYRSFISYVDLWARHAFLVDPPDARLRMHAMLHLLLARMPKPVTDGGLILHDGRYLG